MVGLRLSMSFCVTPESNAFCQGETLEFVVSGSTGHLFGHLQKTWTEYHYMKEEWKNESIYKS